MGPYCKFCGDRCFIPTTKEDTITSDLKATCKEGKIFDIKQTMYQLERDLHTYTNKAPVHELYDRLTLELKTLTGV